MCSLDWSKHLLEVHSRRKHQRFAKSAGITSSPNGPIFKNRKTLESKLPSVFVLGLLKMSATRMLEG